MYEFLMITVLSLSACDHVPFLHVSFFRTLDLILREITPQLTDNINCYGAPYNSKTYETYKATAIKSMNTTLTTLLIILLKSRR